MAKTDPPDLNLLYRAGVLVVLSRDMNTLSWACQVPLYLTKYKVPIVDNLLRNDKWDGR
jgi:hypothetical protein